MKFKSLEIIKALEEQVETGYSLKIFKGYVAINKRGVEKLIDELYANLPDDVKAAREYLEKTNHQISRKEPTRVFDNIKELENQIENPLLVDYNEGKRRGEGWKTGKSFLARIFVGREKQQGIPKKNWATPLDVRRKRSASGREEDLCPT